MEDNEDEPKEGVEELREYMQDNLPDMMAQVGEMIVEIDKLDPEDRAERVKEMKEALIPAFEAVAEAGAKFGKAAKKDDDTEEYVEDWGKGYKDTAEELEDIQKLSWILLQKLSRILR